MNIDTYTADGETLERFSSVEQDAIFHQHLAHQGLKLVSHGDTHDIVTILSGAPVEEDVNLDRLRFNARTIAGHMDKLDLTKTPEQRFQIVMAELRATQGVKDITTPFYGVSRVEEPYLPLLKAYEGALVYDMSLAEIRTFIELNLEDYMIAANEPEKHPHHVGWTGRPRRIFRLRQRGIQQ
jgi:hypothetical protein